MKINIHNALRDETIQAKYQELLPKSKACHQLLHSGKGEGSDFLGWVTLPSDTPEELLKDIQQTAKRLREECEYVIAIGIGGSYLGAKAVVEALSNSFAPLHQPEGTRLLFAGHHISEDYMAELIGLVRGHRFGLINISKSGTTTEPAIAFRLLRQLLEAQEGVDYARDHIVAITDQSRGALRTLANNVGYKSYIIPDNIGGRFSVLTPVGLLPIAVAGFDIRELIEGARAMQQRLMPDTEGAKDVEQHAALRNALYQSGKKIELLVNFHPKFHYIGEWWKQLFGESEGKDGKGLFPAAVDFTTDLHSMGQWIQQGERTLFETFISVNRSEHSLTIPEDRSDPDGLNYLAHKPIDDVNKQAELGTMLAHLDGGVPIIHIQLDRLNAYSIGQLFYYFEKLVGISGYLLGVNPFDQPGVESYKNNMFALLHKPGHEEASQAIRSKAKQLK